MAGSRQVTPGQGVSYRLGSWTQREYGYVWRLRLVPASTDDQIAAMRDPKLVGTVKLADDRDCGEGGGFLNGRLKDFIEAPKAVEKRNPGLDRAICATPLGTPPYVQLEDLDRYATR